jgi:mevalonate kinase
MPDYRNFIDKLISKTTHGRVSWKPTTDSDAYAAAIENEFAVRVSQSGKQEFTFEMRDQRGNKMVDISADQAHAWEQGYEEAVENFERLHQLFEAARASALDINSQLLRAESLLDKC